jgi:hypothetical protein
LRGFNDKGRIARAPGKRKRRNPWRRGGVRVEFQRRGDLQNKCLLIEKQNTRNRFCGT